MGKVVSGRSQEGRAIIAKIKRRKAMIKMILIGVIAIVIGSVVIVVLSHLFGLWPF